MDAYDGMTESAYQDMFAKSMRADDPMIFAEVALNPHLELQTILYSMALVRVKEQELEHFEETVDYPPCIICQVLLGQKNEAYLAANLYVGSGRAYQVGCMCSEHENDPDLAAKVIAVFVAKLRELADKAATVDCSKVTIGKP